MSKGKTLLLGELLHQVEEIARAQKPRAWEVVEDAGKQYIEKQSWAEFVSRNEQRARALGPDRRRPAAARGGSPPRKPVELDAINEDPADNRILEYAVSSGSDYIVTGDKDLLRLGRYDDIKILTVADFLEQQQGRSLYGCPNGR